MVFITAMVAAMGAPGIPSAGMVTMILVLQSVGLPVEAITILLPIDRLLDTVRTAVNVQGDMISSLVVQDWLLRKKPINKACNSVKFYFRYVLKLFVALVCSLCLLYGLFYLKITHTANDKSLDVDENFKQELVASIMSAERIVMAEHSDTQDWGREDFEATATRIMRKIGNSNTEIEMLENRSLPVITYREVELNNYQRIKLLLLVKFFAVGKAREPLKNVYGAALARQICSKKRSLLE
jgi:hypothetical protein